MHGVGPLPETLIKALKRVESHPGSTTAEIYKASGSDAKIPEYVTAKLLEKGTIENSRNKPNGWQLTEIGRKELGIYRSDVEFTKLDCP